MASVVIVQESHPRPRWLRTCCAACVCVLFGAAGYPADHHQELLPPPPHHSPPQPRPSPSLLAPCIVSNDGYARASEFHGIASPTAGSLDGIERELTICNKSGALVASVHIYKAAGSYLRKWLQYGCNNHGGRILSHGWREGVRVLRSTALARSPPPFVLAAVRDPVDRFISAMHELVRRNR